MSKQLCRNCKWLKVLPDRDGKVRVRKLETYQCVVPPPPLPALPASLRHVSPQAYRMWPDEGAGCPGFAKREGEST